MSVDESGQSKRKSIKQISTTSNTAIALLWPILSCVTKLLVVVVAVAAAAAAAKVS